MPSRTLTIASGIVAIVAVTEHAWACRCSERNDFAGARATAAAIFSGRCATRSKKSPHRYNVAYTCKVDRVYKGPRRKHITVWAGGHCGGAFAASVRYLVYANRGRGKTLYTNTCLRTRLLKNAKQDLKRLGKGRKP